jgi:hypothetical protein
VRAVLSWSYRILSRPPPGCSGCSACPPGPIIGGGRRGQPRPRVPVAAAGTLRAELTGAHLLAEQRPGRYGFHDLLRAYAAELAATVDPEATGATRCTGCSTTTCTPRVPRQHRDEPAPQAARPARSPGPGWWSPEPRRPRGGDRLDGPPSTRRWWRRVAQAAGGRVTTTTRGGSRGSSATSSTGAATSTTGTPRTMDRAGRGPAAGATGGQAYIHRGLASRVRPAEPAGGVAPAPAAGRRHVRALGGPLRRGPHAPQPGLRARRAGPPRGGWAPRRSGPSSCTGGSISRDGQAISAQHHRPPPDLDGRPAAGPRHVPAGAGDAG